MKENRSKLDAECLITPFLLLLTFLPYAHSSTRPGCSVTFCSTFHMSLGSNKDYCKIKIKIKLQRENEGNRKPKQRLRYASVNSVCACVCVWVGGCEVSLERGREI